MRSRNVIHIGVMTAAGTIFCDLAVTGGGGCMASCASRTPCF